MVRIFVSYLRFTRLQGKVKRLQAFDNAEKNPNLLRPNNLARQRVPVSQKPALRAKTLGSGSSKAPDDFAVGCHGDGGV